MFLWHGPILKNKYIKSNMQKMVSYGVKQDEKDVIAVWKMKRYFEAKLKDKKSDWKTDKLAYFLKKSLSICTFTEDGFLSFILFQCCVIFWLYSENATLWLIFCQFSFIWFTKSLILWIKFIDKFQRLIGWEPFSLCHKKL